MIKYTQIHAHKTQSVKRKKITNDYRLGYVVKVTPGREVTSISPALLDCQFHTVALRLV